VSQYQRGDMVNEYTVVLSVDPDGGMDVLADVDGEFRRDAEGKIILPVEYVYKSPLTRALEETQQLFSSDAFVVIEKPPGLLSDPTAGLQKWRDAGGRAWQFADTSMWLPPNSFLNPDGSYWAAEVSAEQYLAHLRQIVDRILTLPSEPARIETPPLYPEHIDALRHLAEEPGLHYQAPTHQNMGQFLWEVLKRQDAEPVPGESGRAGALTFEETVALAKVNAGSDVRAFLIIQTPGCYGTLFWVTLEEALEAWERWDKGEGMSVSVALYERHAGLWRRER
jgi:hypothetical protein